MFHYISHYLLLFYVLPRRILTSNQTSCILLQKSNFLGKWIKWEDLSPCQNDYVWSCVYFQMYQAHFSYRTMAHEKCQRNVTIIKSLDLKSISCQLYSKMEDLCRYSCDDTMKFNLDKFPSFNLQIPDLNETKIHFYIKLIYPKDVFFFCPGPGASSCPNELKYHVNKNLVRLISEKEYDVNEMNWVINKMNAISHFTYKLIRRNISITVKHGKRWSEYVRMIIQKKYFSTDLCADLSSFVEEEILKTNWTTIKYEYNDYIYVDNTLYCTGYVAVMTIANEELWNAYDQLQNYSFNIILLHKNAELTVGNISKVLKNSSRHMYTAAESAYINYMIGIITIFSFGLMAFFMKLIKIRYNYISKLEAMDKRSTQIYTSSKNRYYIRNSLMNHNMKMKSDCS
ncbi:hypothetical protein SNEBB_004225 [Seison nebaliae]|nr:hypothetical protein SNEBB_004225 [Seison nebaliae]